MKRGILWIVMTFLIVTSMVLASCGTKSTTTSTTSTKSTTTVSTVVTSTSITTSAATATTATTVTTTTSSTGHWWDSIGTPQYGGQLTYSITGNPQNFDPYSGGVNIGSGWGENLFTDDWTLDPAIFGYYLDFRPNDYLVGLLASGWEFTNTSTLVVHIRQNIHFQNIPPVNGRLFTANDVVYHYNRFLGIGGGFSSPAPINVATVIRQNLTSVTATDNYTVVFKWNVNSIEFILETIQQNGNTNEMEAVEAVNLWGNLSDWHHQIGTGPFILTDFVDSSSATLVKNPSYWGYDERYPQNQLPYVSTIKALIIPTTVTALAAVRTGKIDFIDQMAIMDAQGMKKTNPEIIQMTVPSAQSKSIEIRCDLKPFNDVRVRQAAQMAINLPLIASTYYGGTCLPYPASLTSMFLTGYGIPYPDWPQDIKDQYTYNPAGAKKLLADAGYASGFTTNIATTASADQDLLQIALSDMAAVNIKCNIQMMDSAAYSAYTRGFKTDGLFYGGGALGLSFQPLMMFMKYQTGYAGNYSMFSDATYDSCYARAIAATSTDAFKQILLDENIDLARKHVGISLLTPKYFAFIQPWFKGYNGQDGALTRSASDWFFGFYTSRFWIDVNIKKSYGH